MRVSACLAVLALLAGCGDDEGTGGKGGSGPGGGAPGSGGAGGGTGGAIPDDCTEIVQVPGPSTYFSVDAVGFEFSPAKASAPPEVVVVSPNINGLVAAGNYTFTGPDSEIISYAIEDAVVDLINAPDGAMDRRIFAAAAGVVSIDEAPDYGTQFQGRIAGTLANVEYRELADDFTILPGGECWFLRTGSFDASTFDGKCDAPTDIGATPSGGACLSDFIDLGHECNPVTNDGCMPMEICDLGLNFQCFPVMGNEVGLCETCDNDEMAPTYCRAGMTCDGNNDQGKCHRYCCTDADCGGGRCIAYYAYGVGVCMTE